MDAGTLQALSLVAVQAGESTDGPGPEAVPDKLFSSIEYTKDEEAVHSPGSVFGAAALVAGTTVGAGILAVPFVTADSGFVAASGAMTGPRTAHLLADSCAGGGLSPQGFTGLLASAGMWAYSVVCGLLLAEVNLNTLSSLGRTEATITTMAERTLGSSGSRVVGASYLFLHCAMLVACAPPGPSAAQLSGCLAANKPLQSSRPLLATHDRSLNAGRRTAPWRGD